MIRLEHISKVFPTLSYQRLKGNNGIIGVIGGSIQYTGAPFYAAMSALKMGADMSHIFCCKQAGTAIKSYSPELIVHPIFDYNNQSDNLSEQQRETKVGEWIAYLRTKFLQINCWVIGPGLGRSAIIGRFFASFISQLPEKSNVVIDADGLYFLCKFEAARKRLQMLNCVLTPNHRQFKHLNQFLNIDLQEFENIIKNQQPQNKSIGFRSEIKQSFLFTIVLKGQYDLILHPTHVLSTIMTKGGKKRCGGIGDILAGCIASSIIWDYHDGPLLASHIVKTAASKAFAKHGRSCTALCILQKVEQAVKSVDQQQ